jgi:hypothetical protein
MKLHSWIYCSPATKEFSAVDILDERLACRPIGDQVIAPMMHQRH